MTAIKAIETVYNGYRFRSRLEARWAVFFDELGITYEYEPEGFSLNNNAKHYLPDFKLSQENMYIEIKGQKPTQDEHNKAFMLAWESHKYVVTLYGSIEIPHLTSIEYHPYLFLTKAFLEQGTFFDPEACLNGGFKSLSFQDISSTVANALVSMRENGAFIACTPLGVTYIWPDKPNNDPFPEWNWLQHEFTLMAEKAKLTHGVWIPNAHSHEGAFGECRICHCVQWFQNRSKPGYICKEPGCTGTVKYDTPRLIAAYTAARQARFEHGESGAR